MTTLEIPKGPPKGEYWSSTRKYADCEYVYVRFEDHAVSVYAPETVIKLMEALAERAKENPKGSGIFALNASPMLAEQLFCHTNCSLTPVSAVTRVPGRTHGSKRYIPKRS